MYSRSMFGNYYPVESTIHKLNPIFKLIDFIIYFVVSIFSKSLYLHLFMFGLVSVMILMSNVPLKFFFNMVFNLRFVCVIVILLLALLGFNLHFALIILLKIITMVLYLGLLIYTTSTTEIVYGVQKIIWVFNIFNRDTIKVSVFITYCLGFIPTLLNTEDKVLKSMSGRGVDYYHSGLIGKIYSRLTVFKSIIRLTKERMNKLMLSNELRLFTFKTDKTNYRTNPIGVYDIFILLFHVFFIYAFIIGVDL